MKKSNERSNEKSNDLFFREPSTFELRRKKIDALKLFEFVEQFMMDTFFIKLTQFEKTGSIRTTFISLGNLIIKLHIRN